MRCESAMIRLDELLQGELEPAESTLVESHLASCESCSAWLEDVRQLTRQAPRLMGECPISCATTVIDRFAPLDLDASRYWVAWSVCGIRRIAPAHAGEDESGFLASYDRLFRKPLEPGNLPPEYRRQIARALKGWGSEAPPVDLEPLPEFERRVLAILLEIPHAEVRSYAWVAREAGRPRAVRAVGNACARNPVPFLVPCHRVVPSTGGLGRYALGPSFKRSLLESEGVDLAALDTLTRQRARYVGSRQGAFYCFPTCTGVGELAPADRVLLHDDREALAGGYEPCERCRPMALGSAWGAS